MFAAVALISLQPWAPTSLAPLPKVSPQGGGIALDDSVVVAPAQQGPGSSAHVADVGHAALVAEPVTAATGGSGPKLGISPGRPTPRAGLVSLPVPPPEPSPTPVVAAPEPGPEPGPESVPVSTTAPASKPPLVAGVGNDPPEEGAEDGEAEGVPICEGDEYVVIAFFDTQTIADEEPTVDILIRRLESDGSQSETYLDDLSIDDARTLVGLLVSVGSCEWIEAEPFGGGGEVWEVTEVGFDATVLGDTLESVLP